MLKRTGYCRSCSSKPPHRRVPVDSVGARFECRECKSTDVVDVTKEKPS